MIPYNHEKYIRDAIEGVMMQQRDFEIESVIGEDCSTNETRAIYQEYVERYPSVIRVMPTKQKAGMMPSFLRTLRSCVGRYVALWGDCRGICLSCGQHRGF
jgi:glycosyltransferase involved in cell wall biosynthesis